MNNFEERMERELGFKLPDTFENRIRQGDFSMLDDYLAAGGKLTDPFRCGSLLCYAVQYGTPSDIQNLLERRCDLNEINADGKGLLHLALYKQKTENALYIIDQGINLQQVDNYGTSTLYYAVDRWDAKVAHHILEKGYDVSGEDYELLDRVILKDLPTLIPALAARGMDLNGTSKGQKGNTLFIEACRFDRPECIDELLKYEIDLYAKGEQNFDALEHLGNNRSLKSLDRLVEKHIEHFNPETQALLKHMKLFYDGAKAIQQQNLPLFQSLITKDFDMSATYRGVNLFFIAIENRALDIAAYLLSIGADVNSSNSVKESALFHAAEEDDEKGVEFLLKSGANPNLQDEHGLTALFVPGWHGYTKILELLFQHGADPNIKSKTRETALKYTHMSEEEKEAKKALDIFRKYKHLLNEEEQAYLAAI